MTDYTELITRLRSTKSRSKRKLLDEAADVIERIVTDIDVVRKDNEALLKTVRGFRCLYCKHETFSEDHIPMRYCEMDLTAQQCHDMDAWEWRGVHE